MTVGGYVFGGREKQRSSGRGAKQQRDFSCNDVGGRERWGKEEGGASCKEDAPVQGRSIQRAPARLGMGQGLGRLGVRSPDVYG